jgi:two-component system NarL family sensor kinase
MRARGCDNGAVRAASRPPSKDAPRPVSVGGLVLQFAVAGAIAFFVLAAVTAYASRRVGTREAASDARRVAWVSGQTLVASALDDGVVTLDPRSLAALDKVVRERILGGSLVRVKLWRGDGTIVYSDEGRLIGDRYELGEDELEALELGIVDAEISDLAKPENRFESPNDELFEVYLPIETPNGTRLLFEAYFLNDGVSDAGRRVWLSFAPFTLGSLAVLQLVQIPLAWSLARRLRRGQQAREQLLAHAVDSSNAERRRIAADLHDGVVQDMSGVSYTLAALARSDALGDDGRLIVEDAAARLRETVRQLRSLLVEIYPPNLQEEGLESAIGDLLARLENRGTATSLRSTIPPGTTPAPEVAALVYRVAQEVLRNVVTHAHAQQVSVELGYEHDRFVLVIDDDGVGFDPLAAGGVTDDGHVGLRVMIDLVQELGGTLHIESAPSAGTAVRLEVPT